jgi:hypothetical protein
LKPSTPAASGIAVKQMLAARAFAALSCINLSVAIALCSVNGDSAFICSLHNNQTNSDTSPVF